MVRDSAKKEKKIFSKGSILEETLGFVESWKREEGKLSLSSFSFFSLSLLEMALFTNSPFARGAEEEAPGIVRGRPL